MTIIQELYQNPELVSRCIREAKERKHLTTAQLADLTGIPESTLSKQLSNPRADPKLSTFIALCKALDISVDTLFDLRQPEESAAVLRDRLHAEELKNAQLSAENLRLKELAQLHASQLSARTPIIYILLIACLVQSCALVAYLFIDAQIVNAGLIRFGNLSPVAWLLIALIVAAIGSCVWATMRFSRKSRRKER